MAEEVAQEVLVTVWRKAAHFDAAKAGAATWIYTIARNRRIDLHRRAGRPEPDPHDPAFRPEPERSAERHFADAARDARLRAALADLPREQIEVLRLAFYAGHSHGEIAERLALPLGTVKSRLRLSFARLRSTLGDEFSAELVDE
jgi:RNA polymerase sigma-70 factor (ECF subfamily)